MYCTVFETFANVVVAVTERHHSQGLVGSEQTSSHLKQCCHPSSNPNRERSSTRPLRRLRPARTLPSRLRLALRVASARKVTVHGTRDRRTCRDLIRCDPLAPCTLDVQASAARRRILFFDTRESENVISSQTHAPLTLIQVDIARIEREELEHRAAEGRGHVPYVIPQVDLKARLLKSGHVSRARVK